MREFKELWKTQKLFDGKWETVSQVKVERVNTIEAYATFDRLIKGKEFSYRLVKEISLVAVHMQYHQPGET